MVDSKFIFLRLSIWILQILGSMKTYIAINFKINKISWDMYKLIHIDTYIN